MSSYSPSDYETKWQTYWQQHKTFAASEDTALPKQYILDMFPYPSGAGLHVGHPLGYIASDIVARYKRHCGFNVLHPMGFDSFGLPAEQYAIQTGQHPAKTTEENIATYKAQLNKLGLSFDWDREIRTSDPDFYRWTQWIFEQLYNCYYDLNEGKARPIQELILFFEQHGSAQHPADGLSIDPLFSADQWKTYSSEEKESVLARFRLTYQADALVNWCPALGTVLANDEVKDGVSERGGHPVERRNMQQWMMRITAYADRLLANLDTLDWSDAVKEMQRNWIGKSIGCELDFQVEGKDLSLTAFTTRVDTIYGVTYLVIAPEHELALTLTTPEQRNEVKQYIEAASNRSERDRQADVKESLGVFTGSYVINPFTQEAVPLWIADYVLAGYGTGVVMAVPSSDDRDHRFAQKYKLPIVCVIEGTEALENPTEVKRGKLINSGPLNGLDTDKAIQQATQLA